MGWVWDDMQRRYGRGVEYGNLILVKEFNNDNNNIVFQRSTDRLCRTHI